MKTTLIISLFFTFLGLQAQTFGNQNIIINSNADGAIDVFAADLNGDGNLDVLSASRNNNRVAWYENIDGSGTFGDQQIISINASGIQSVYAADIDGDGDIDVLSASANDNKIAWYENMDGNGTFGNQQIITTNVSGGYDVFAIDIDGDGDIDVLSASHGKIAWYENTDGNGTFGSQQIITTAVSVGISVFATDLDGDGDMDVLSASFNDDKIAWYENIDGNGTFGNQQIIVYSNGAYSVFAADIDNDGDMDVLSAGGSVNRIAWHENDGNGNFASQQIITTTANGACSVFAADIDGDGDIDVLSASRWDDKIAWYENTDGNGVFSNEKIITNQNEKVFSVIAADIDGDGDMDVLSASDLDDKIAWYENMDGNGNFAYQQVLTIAAAGADSVFSVDIDGDGDMDVLSASWYDDKIAWYENTDGNGAFGNQQIITTLAAQVNSIFSADIDGDGDMDIVSASGLGVSPFSGSEIAWYENIDGHGTFSNKQIITTLVVTAISIFVTDIDGDGDMDVVSASKNDNKIAWYENTDGNGAFGNQQVIINTAYLVTSVYAEDLDGDGDMDVLSSSFGDNRIAWYENTDGLGTFGNQQIITTSIHSGRSVIAADIDNDGDMDVLSASSFDHKIAWYENTDGSGTFGSQQIISNTNCDAYSILASDLDNDGDLDILSACRSFNKIVWYENTDGNGTFGNQQIISTTTWYSLSVFASDIDGDGDMDVLSASGWDDKIAWYENLSISLDLAETQTLQFTIFPIPAKSRIQIISTSEIATIHLYNQLGQLILSNKNQKTMDISKLKKGVYYCKIEDINGHFGLKSIIKN